MASEHTHGAVEAEAHRGTWLFCRECHFAHRVSAADRAPVFALDGSTHPVDDLQAFLRDHEGHPVGALARSSDRELRSRPRWDPMNTLAVEASDGEASFVIVSERADVASPRRYLVRPGRLVAVEESATLDEALLRDVVDDALFPYAAPASILDALIDRVRTLVERTPLDDFDLVDEERQDPTIELAGLPASVIEPFRAVLAQLFKREEAARVLGLLDRELRGELPVVRIRRRYVVAE